MQLLGSEILIATNNIRDDAFCMLIDFLKRDEETLFRFDELKMFHYTLITLNGMIQASDSYIQYSFSWQGEEWYLNTGSYYDNICKKYSIYPKYLNLR